MPNSPKVRDLSALVRAQAKRAAREGKILVQLAAQLDDALTGEDTNDSPQEGTHDRDNRSH